MVQLWHWEDVKRLTEYFTHINPNTNILNVQSEYSGKTVFFLKMILTLVLFIFFAKIQNLCSLSSCTCQQHKHTVFAGAVGSLTYVNSFAHAIDVSTWCKQQL